MMRGVIFGLLCLAWSAAPCAETAIDRVEQGLMLPLTVADEPSSPMNLTDRMAHHGVTSISIAVIEDGALAWSRTYGDATPDTRYQAGSLSKPLAAAAALALVDAGEVSLDKPINDFLTSWRSPRDVTLHQILSHTAGFTVHGFRGYRAGEAVPTLRQVLDGAPPANSAPVTIDQEPGERFRYSGGGYTVLQQLVEDVTEASFADAMHAAVLGPLGMKNSTFTQQPEHPRAHVFPELAAAGLWSTPTDLAHFVVAVLNDTNGLRRLIEPQVALGPDKHAGLGLLLDGSGRAARFTHAGSTPGYRAYLIGFPETGQGAVFMSDADSSPALMQEIMRAVAAEYDWPERFHRTVVRAELDAAALEALTGTYHFDMRGRAMQLVVRSVAGGLAVDLPDGSTGRMIPESTTRFVDPETNRVLVFTEPGTVQVPGIGVTATRR